MYLSRVILNPRSRDVHRDMADVQDMHRTVMSAFPDDKCSGDARSRMGVLYRLETARSGRLTVLVQSRQEPDWSALPPTYLAETGGEVQNPAVKSVGKAFRNIRRGDRLVFRLRANPARKIETKTGPDGKRRHGRRVELNGEERQTEWLRRKGDQAGFALPTVSPKSDVLNLRALPQDKFTGRRTSRDPGGVAPSKRAITLRTVLFEGVLEVTDEARFLHALQEGIGPGKAYGCGLLSVRPVRG